MNWTLANETLLKIKQTSEFSLEGALILWVQASNKWMYTKSELPAFRIFLYTATTYILLFAPPPADADNVLLIAEVSFDF